MGYTMVRIKASPKLGRKPALPPLRSRPPGPILGLGLGSSLSHETRKPFYGSIFISFLPYSQFFVFLFCVNRIEWLRSTEHTFDDLQPHSKIATSAGPRNRSGRHPYQLWPGPLGSVAWQHQPRLPFDRRIGAVATLHRRGIACAAPAEWRRRRRAGRHRTWLLWNRRQPRKSHRLHQRKV